jgi:hypothetical protein
VLALALIVRLAFIATRPPLDWFEGGDGPWYVRQGWLIAHDALPSPLRTVGPLYPLLLAGIWLAFPGHGDPAGPLAIAAGYLTTVRIVQAVLGTLTVALAWALTRRLTRDDRAAMVTALAVGFGPAFVMEPFLLHTETLFMVLLTGTVLLQGAAPHGSTPGRAALTGIAGALTVLTRPVLALFPWVLAGHLLVRHGSQRGGRRAGALLLASALTLLPWHAWLYHGTGRWLPEGLAANLWMGARVDSQWIERAAFHEAERRLAAADRGYAAEALRLIAADPGAWLGRRATHLLAAIVQPHGIADLGGPSVKDAVGRWLREDRSVRGALRITGRPGFWTRVAAYVLHAAALTLALLGAWASRHRWRTWLPVYAAVAYPVFVHALLPASPRYLFPAEVFLWVLGGFGVARVGRRAPAAAPQDTG